METDYYKNKASVEEYIKLAKDVNGREHIDKLRPYLNNSSSVLEIGSGPGSDWKILSEIYNVTGSDNSKEFLDHLKANNSEGTFLALDAVTLKTEKYFDALYSNKVLHHLSDKELRNSIARQAAILNSGGVICHTFWKGEGSEVFKEMFVNYQDMNSLKTLFSNAFDVVTLSVCTEFEKDDSILLIAIKKKISYVID